MPQPSPLQELTSWILDLVQIVFYFVVTVLTYLTYTHARKTILQPMKAETYKEQIRVLTVIAETYCGYSESQLCAQSGLHELVNMNAQKVQDDFVRDHGTQIIDPETRLYAKSNTRETTINLKSQKAEEWVLLQCPSDEVEAAPLSERQQPKRDWSTFVWEELHLPKVFVEARDKLSALLRHPLLPQDVQQALVNYEKSVEANVLALQELLTTAGRELDDKLRRERQLKLNTHFWIVTRFGAVTTPLMPATEILSRSIRSYMKADEVMS